MMLFKERIQKYEYKLNDTDDQIVEYLIHNKPEAVTLSIQHLASKFYTVPNTITRLSKKLGYDGFSHMKNSLKEEVQNQTLSMEDSLLFNITKTFSLIDYDKLNLVSKMLQEANRVLFFAVGDTAPLCEVMVKNLKVGNKHAEYYFHRHDMIYEANQLAKSDVLFLISLSGETAQVLDIADIAKKKQIRLISLTHFEKNTLQQAADVNLYCYSPQKMLNNYNVTDKTPVMLVLQALTEAYWGISK